MRYEEFVRQTLEKQIGSGRIKPKELPMLDLYIDQAAAILNRQFGGLESGKTEQMVTKSMVNNYTKHGLMHRPKNKKYSKSHLILLTYVLHLKGILPMNDIQLLMRSLVENQESPLDEKIDLEQLYQISQDLQTREQEILLDSNLKDMDLIKHLLQESELADDDMLELFLLIVNLSIKANAERYLAEKLLSEYFMRPSKQKVKKEKKPAKADKEKQELPD